VVRVQISFLEETMNSFSTSKEYLLASSRMVHCYDQHLSMSIWRQRDEDGESMNHKIIQSTRIVLFVWSRICIYIYQWETKNRWMRWRTTCNHSVIDRTSTIIKKKRSIDTLIHLNFYFFKLTRCFLWFSKWYFNTSNWMRINMSIKIQVLINVQRYIYLRIYSLI